MNQLNQNLILECLKELSDRQLQESLWMGTISSQQSSFIEAVEGLFTDSGLGDELRQGKTGFSKEAESKLRELEEQVARVHTKDGPAGVINDPAMSQVRDLAVCVLELLEREMIHTFSTLPGWTFNVDEVSVGVYRAFGRDQAGRNVEATGLDPNALVEKCKQLASKIMADQKADGLSDR